MGRTPLKLAAVGISLLAGLATTLAFRGFFDRPGEAAVGMMPADADAIVTVDLVPAPSQVVAFRNIEGALDRSGKESSLMTNLTSELGEPELGQAVGPYLGRSMALLVYMDQAKGAKFVPDGVAFISLNDKVAAEVGLRKKFKPVIEPTEVYYPLKDGRAVRVVDTYLEVATNPKYFAKLDAVRDGKEKSALTAPGLRTVRSLAEPAANIKAFWKNDGAWSLLTGSIDDSGVAIVVRGAKTNGGKQVSFRPFSQSAITSVPSGPYALFGVSQLAQLTGDMTKQAGGLGDSLRSTFGGDTFIGLYPSERSPRAGLDLLIALHGANKATPPAGFKAIRKEIEKQFMDGQPLFDKPKKVGRATYYRLAPSLKGMFTKALKSSPKEINAKVMFSDKTIAYATIGQTLYLSTSDRLLKRCIATHEGTQPSLAVDGPFKPAGDAVKGGSQMLLDLSLPRMIEGIANSTTKGSTTAAQARDALKVVTHGEAIIDLHGGLNQDGSIHARVYVPIDYTKLAQLVGARA